MKRYLHPDREDTTEKAVLAVRILTVALSQFMRNEGDVVTVTLDGASYTVYVHDKQICVEPGGDEKDDSTDISISRQAYTSTKH